MAPENPANRSLVLERPDLNGLPPADLPVGVALSAYQTGDESVWTHIWCEAEPFDEIADSVFRDSLGNDEALLAARVYFAVDEATGTTVGTVTAWSEETPSKGHPALAGWGRVHWLAVLPAYQGRGIGKALFLHSLHRLRDLGHQETFLVTSSGRITAVVLYERHGFRERPKVVGA